MRFQKIKTARRIGQSPALDFEVDHPDHNFIANGFVVSNSHSTSYAYIGYVCQYLKTNYPLEWWASVLNNANLNDLKEAARYVRDSTDSPDVNKSHLEFYIIDDGRGKLLFPLNRVKNVKNAGTAIATARLDENGNDKPFLSMEDFLNRVEKRLVNKRVVLSLIWAGAFDRMCGAKTIIDRNQIVRQYHEIRKDKKTLGELTDLTEVQVMEKQIENLAIGEADFVELLRKKLGGNIQAPCDVVKFEKGDQIRLGGRAERVKVTKTKNRGEPMCFIDILNESDAVSVTVFPQEYSQFKSIIKEGAIMVISGKVDTYNAKKQLLASDIKVYFSEEADEESNSSE